MRAACAWPPGRRPWCLSLLCLIIAAINRNFLTFGNFVRMSQDAAIPLVLGLGETFIILMGSIDLSVEGVLTLAAVILSMTVLNGMNDNNFGLFAVLLVLAVGAVRRLRQRRRPCPAQGALVHGDARLLVHRRGDRQRAARRHGDPDQRSVDPRPCDPASARLSLGRLAGARLSRHRFRHPEPHASRPLYLRSRAAERNSRRYPAFRSSWVRIVTFTLAGVFYAIGGVLAAAQLGLGNAQIGNGRLFTTVTAVVVGGTSLSGGEGGVLQTFVGVLIVSVLSNGMVLMGVPPSVQIGLQGLMIIGAVALSIDRKARIVK